MSTNNAPNRCYVPVLSSAISSAKKSLIGIVMYLQMKVGSRVVICQLICTIIASRQRPKLAGKNSCICEIRCRFILTDHVKVFVSVESSAKLEFSANHIHQSPVLAFIVADLFHFQRDPSTIMVSSFKSKIRTSEGIC
jgi:hypothetical protein